jgi:hypothetical protein
MNLTLIGWMLLAIAAPFWVAGCFFRRRLHPDTYLLCTAFFTFPYIVGAVAFLIVDIRHGDAIGEYISFITIPVITLSFRDCVSGWIRGQAEAVR